MLGMTFSPSKHVLSSEPWVGAACGAGGEEAGDATAVASWGSVWEKFPLKVALQTKTKFLFLLQRREGIMEFQNSLDWKGS